MNDIAVEELSARAMIEEVIAEVQSEFSKKSAEERAFILIKGFFGAVERIWEAGEEIPDKMSDEFFEWFHDPRNYAAKMRALDKIMEMDDELWEKYGICCKRSYSTPDNEQDMPDFGRLKQILGNNQSRI